MHETCLEHLIGLLYDAAGAPAAWPTTLEALGDALGRGRVPELQLQPPHMPIEHAVTLPLPNAYNTIFPSRWAPAPTRDSALAPTSVSRVAPTGDPWAGGIVIA